MTVTQDNVLSTVETLLTRMTALEEAHGTYTGNVTVNSANISDLQHTSNSILETISQIVPVVETIIGGPIGQAAVALEESPLGSQAGGVIAKSVAALEKWAAALPIASHHAYVSPTPPPAPAETTTVKQ